MVRAYIFKLLVLGAVLLPWALVAGNSEQIGSAQPSTETSGRLVWFAPNMDAGGPDTWPSGVLRFSPPEDARKLFEPGAPWPSGRAGIQVFKFYIDVLGGLYNLPVSQAIQALKDANIAIAVEAGGLRDWECSGARMAQIELAKMAPITRAGAQLSYLHLDSPFAHTLASDSSNPCQYTIEQAASQLLVYIKAVKQQYPNVKIGLSEPVPHYTVGEFRTQGGLVYGDLLQLLDTVQAILKQGGEALDFFHADGAAYDWVEALPGRQGWAKLKALQDFVRSRGMRFGILYNSARAGRTSDELFFHETLALKAKFAQIAGDPDDLVVQSWSWYPRQWLPEDQPYTYTYLLKKFLTAEVPELSLTVGPPSVGDSRQITGTLKDQTGHPIVNAPIEFFVTPLTGQGQFAEYTEALAPGNTVPATVPAGVAQAIVLVRVNRACACAGTSDFTLYEVRYTEGNETTNRVPNGNFSQGLEGWGWRMSTGTVLLEPSDRGPGQMLHVMATPTQTVILNGTPFAVTAGATYTTSFAARVAPISIGSGYFAVVFLDSSGNEVRRLSIPFDLASISIGQTITDANGAFQFTLRDLPEGQLLLEASYPGDDERYLPAWASVTLESRR